MPHRMIKYRDKYDRRRLPFKAKLEVRALREMPISIELVLFYLDEGDIERAKLHLRMMLAYCDLDYPAAAALRREFEELPGNPHLEDDA